MLTLQHTLVTLLSYNFFSKKETPSSVVEEDIKRLEEEIPYVLLPDALRRYLGPRQYTHFEESADGSDISWLKYPEAIKLLSSKDSVATLKKHLASDIKPCVLGEKTNINAFVKNNMHLPSNQFYRNIKAFKTRLYV